MSQRDSLSHGITALIAAAATIPHLETWHIYFGDVRVGSIGVLPGVPLSGLERWSDFSNKYIAGRRKANIGTSPQL